MTDTPKILLSLIGIILLPGSGGFQHARAQEMTMPEVLPGTAAITWEKDRFAVSDELLDGAHRLIDEKISESVERRLDYWTRDFDSKEAYEESVEPNRRRFMKNIGVIDKSVPRSNFNIGLEEDYPAVSMEKYSLNNDPELVAETEQYRVYQVRWPVLNRVNGEGLLLQPKDGHGTNVIALPDADQAPEQLVGLSPGVPAESQYARHLAENGFQVLVPVLISRIPLFPGERNQQTNREWIYRQAFHMGRHVIGYEVQKVLSAVDWFKQMDGDAKVGVAGYNEGGLIAFYSAAVDKRIDAALVSGYFESRENVWEEPIYRNVWDLLTEFGDAEIASLIAPRSLVIEHSSIPAITDKIISDEEVPFEVGGLPYTGYKGRLETPESTEVQSEFQRIEQILPDGFQARHLITGPDDGPVNFGSEEAVRVFVQALGYQDDIESSGDMPIDNRSSFDPGERQLRQTREINDHVQRLVRVSDIERNNFFLHKVMPEFAERTWSTKSYHPYYSPEHFINEGKEFRAYFWEDILGKFEEEALPPNAKTRKIFVEARWTGYEVVLDTYPEFHAAGVLLVPNDIASGEERPVVVTQHGRGDVPHQLVEGNNTAYNNVAAKLADKGFVVFAPYALYRGEDEYRWLDRKANTVGKTLFSFIISQHEQYLDWIGGLSFVDKDRIAFYGLSYGGEVAMRIPAVLEEYSLSIASGDFGDWTRKVADTYNPYSFMNTLEWEMPYFNMGSTFSYAEMAYLIFPRPFMVERGHDDLVQPDEWVSSEYGKVNYLYNQFNHGDKTEIEFFNGGHSMRSEGTFQFLHEHLNWP